MLLLISSGIVLLFLATVFVGAPYVPSHRHQVRTLFTELYPLTADDLVIDIGSGDGVVLQEAARQGAWAIGYEINPILVGIAYLRLYRHRQRVQVRLANLWTVQFPPATTVVYTFGESRDIGRMYRKVQQEATRLKKTLYFISYGFTVQHQTAVRSQGAHHVYKITPLQ